MELDIRRKDGKAWVEGRPGKLLIREEADVLDLMAAGGPEGVRAMLLHQDNLAPQFYDLKTGLAGAVFQKLANYSFRAALVVDLDAVGSERFRELARECNRGGDIRFFADRGGAERWIAG